MMRNFKVGMRVKLIRDSRHQEHHDLKKGDIGIIYSTDSHGDQLHIKSSKGITHILDDGVELVLLDEELLKLKEDML